MPNARPFSTSRHRPTSSSAQKRMHGLCGKHPSPAAQTSSRLRHPSQNKVFCSMYGLFFLSRSLSLSLSRSCFGRACCAGLCMDNCISNCLNWFETGRIQHKRENTDTGRTSQKQCVHQIPVLRRSLPTWEKRKYLLVVRTACTTGARGIRLHSSIFAECRPTGGLGPPLFCLQVSHVSMPGESTSRAEPLWGRSTGE